MRETFKAIESEDLSRRAKLNMIVENNRELRCYVANLLSGIDKIDENPCFYKTNAMLEDWKRKPLTAYIERDGSQQETYR